MKRVFRLLIGLFLLPLAIVPVQAVEQDFREALRHRLESIPADQPLLAGRTPVPASDDVRAFYERRLYRPAWVRADDGSAPQAKGLLRGLDDAMGDGMDPTAYHLNELRRRLRGLKRLATEQMLLPRHLVDMELLLTGVWLQLGTDSLIGRLNPEKVDPAWHIQPPTADLVHRLEEALAGDQVYETLRAMLPSVHGYTGLRKALDEYRGIVGQGGFTRVPQGPLLRFGMRDPRVVLLRERLYESGDLQPDLTMELTLFDGNVESAVRTFQARHGLHVDGVVGPATLTVLNVPAEERVRQLMVNMERWRWLPRDPGEWFIMVNIAGYDMVVMERGVPIIRQRVIVGRDYRQTPVFTGNMTYLVLNPSWEVPNSIAVRDILPQVQRDPDYLRRMRFRVLQGWGEAEQKIDPDAVDWQSVSVRNFPYRFRQEPGPLNALGTVKFMFPNRYAVYLHDTPARNLFQQSDRAFSSGCIRVEHPLDLVDFLLESSSRWTPQAIREALADGRERTVTLPRAIPVHLVYMTAWVDSDGTLQLRQDIYNRDQRVSEALLPLNSRG